MNLKVVEYIKNKVSRALNTIWVKSLKLCSSIFMEE